MLTGALATFTHYLHDKKGPTMKTPPHPNPELSGGTPVSRVLLDAFERVHEIVPSVVEGLDSQQLTWRPDPEANSIGWLLWHLARVEDSHLADLDNADQLWTQDGWVEKFHLPYNESDIGFGQDSDTVGQFFVADPTILITYCEAVHSRTRDIVSALTEKDYERVIDDSYDPPVTVAARLVSVVNDTTQHIGQASYVRGLVERRGR